MPTGFRLPPAIRNRPPSARLVFAALQKSDRALSTDELSAETGVSVDRVRRLLGDLQDDGVVTADDHPHDGRRHLWSLPRSQTEDTPASRAATDPAEHRGDVPNRRHSGSNPPGER